MDEITNTGSKGYPSWAFDPRKYKFDKFGAIQPHESQIEFFKKMTEKYKKEKLAKIERVKNRRKASTHGKCKKVIDTETGVIYDSLKDAANFMCIQYNKLHSQTTRINKNGYGIVYYHEEGNGTPN